MSLSRMSFIPRVTGGAALRTRSDDSSGYASYHPSGYIDWLLATSWLWIPAGIALIAGIVYGIVYAFREYDICERLRYLICSPVILLKIGFEKLYHLISKLYHLISRKAAPREQQTIPAPIEMENIRNARMQYVRSDSPDPPDYERCLSLEEPLPVYKP
ncbi:hypothetical protein ACN38_g4757 [Penicillium nordicum]|uniref:Uncharacterized protein n=1 Tax=Penicillium nordicum TaxID=229535 RepID=A0A0M9WGT3_9EURO|nr:hypothetical protein ACN38_g4757 [Penicillium nordicum]